MPSVAGIVVARTETHRGRYVKNQMRVLMGEGEGRQAQQESCRPNRDRGGQLPSGWVIDPVEMDQPILKPVRTMSRAGMHCCANGRVQSGCDGKIFYR